jgi:hypothetical protein
VQVDVTVPVTGGRGRGFGVLFFALAMVVTVIAAGLGHGKEGGVLRAVGLVGVGGFPLSVFTAILGAPGRLGTWRTWLAVVVVYYVAWLFAFEWVVGSGRRAEWSRPKAADSCQRGSTWRDRNDARRRDGVASCRASEGKLTERRPSRECASALNLELRSACRVCPKCSDTSVAANQAGSCAFCDTASFPCIVNDGRLCTVMWSCRERTVLDMDTGAGAIVDTLCR